MKIHLMTSYPYQMGLWRFFVTTFKTLIVCFLIELSGYPFALAEDQTDEQTFLLDKSEKWSYEKPNYWNILTEVPDTSVLALKTSFSKDALAAWAVILSSTAVLYQYDEDILLEVQKWGRDIGIGNEENTRTYVRAGNIPLFRAPSDVGSALYYIGDGWTHTGIALSFFTYGQLNDDYRAQQTSLQLVHGMIVSTLFSQTLKRSMGRESPIKRTSKRGTWRPFPSVAEYGRNTAAYDAFPSGHIMTATLTLTVINENYPEYSHWVLPIGWTLVSLLGFEMINNSVHWASDYPLGIAMGILFGKLSARIGRKRFDANGLSTEKTSSFDILPLIEPGAMGLQAFYRF